MIQTGQLSVSRVGRVGGVGRSRGGLGRAGWKVGGWVGGLVARLVAKRLVSISEPAEIK